MSKELDRVVEHAYERLSRATPPLKSKQPRFTNSSELAPELYTSVLKWVTYSRDHEPPYSTDSRTRDQWLSNFWTEEPHWAGVISSVNMIDANRGWTVIGGRNQVARFVPILKNADDGNGWRQWISQQSTGFYTTDIGPITELGRDGEGGPLRAIYHVDPTKCMLTGKRETPLKYDNNRNPWTPEDYFRLVSMKNIRDEYNGLGICATSRAKDMAELMLGIYGHQMEMIGARAPKGLLLLQNISQEQWDEAMRIRDAKLDSDMRRYYNAVAVIAQQGFDNIDAKLVALSQLPEGFDLEVFTNLLMYAYALCIGYDPIEFWPVLAGQLGRGRETDIQHRKGTGKGGLNFMLAMQEAIQGEFPDTLHFEFEQRDQEGVLLDVQVAQAAANLVSTLYSNKGSQIPGPRGSAGGDGEPPVENQTPALEPLIDRDEARTLLVKYGVIPDSWTQQEEELKATDAAGIERLRREELMENDRVRRAAYQFPHEPIVRYKWPHDKMEVLFAAGEDALKAQRFSLVKPLALIPDFSEIDDAMRESHEEAIRESNGITIREEINSSEITVEIRPEKIFTQEKNFILPEWMENGWLIPAGSGDQLTIEVKNSAGKEIDVSRSPDISFYLFEPQNGNPVLVKKLSNGINVTGNVVDVTIHSGDTLSLCGVYTYAVRVTDDLNRVFTVHEGNLFVTQVSVDA